MHPTEPGWEEGCGQGPDAGQTYQAKQIYHTNWNTIGGKRNLKYRKQTYERVIIYLGFFASALISTHISPLRACCHFSHVQLFVIPWTVAHQVPLSMGFSRQEYWSGLPGPPRGELPDAGIEPASLTSLALAGRFFTTGAPREAIFHLWATLY